MQRIGIVLFAFLVCFATAMQAQTAAPKPSPELKKLRPPLGHWTYEAESKAGPSAPSGKLTGEHKK